MNLRPATAADVGAISGIVARTDMFPPDMLEGMIAGYLGQTTTDIWFVAENAGHVAAFGFCEPERMTDGTWNLLAIAVDPDAQGSGVGGAMMTYIENRLAQSGARVLIVETMGIAEFASTRAFYAKQGYTEEARIRDFYEDGADKVVFWKSLHRDGTAASDRSGHD